MLSSSYHLNKSLNIYLRDSYNGISYSDGDEIEERIFSVIQNANDLSTLSAELKQHCTDWPSLYHLTPSRANILRPYRAVLEGADVLEIGCGCGAITRYLGECSANVLALEGSPRRAAIARSRTRDLKKVTVVSERFDRFECTAKFDVITLIGVLEYANLFSSGENPALTMLARVRELLKPDGRLIIAIENQLGLKYFAGAPEDHLGIAMYGVEGRYRSDQPQTFGRHALRELLADAGFAGIEFMAPFPDYKLPSSIVTEAGFYFADFYASAFAIQSTQRDPQLPALLTFSPERVWPILTENKIALDMANSFLVTATQEKPISDTAPILAYHFNTERYAAYCKQVIFKVSSADGIVVQSELLAPRVESDSSLLAFNLSPCEPYHQGRPLAAELLDIVTSDGWRIEDVGRFIQRHLLIIADKLGLDPKAIITPDASTLIPGECFDLVPQNIIIIPGDGYKLIDREWVLRNEMPVGWLVFRSMLLMLQAVTRFGACESGQAYSRRTFICAAMQSAGFAIDAEKLDLFSRLESKTQAQVSHRPEAAFTDWGADNPLPLQSLMQAYAQESEGAVLLQQGNAYLKELLKGVNEKLTETAQLLDKERLVHGHSIAQLQKEQQMHEESRKQLETAEVHLNQLMTSLSWRITKPLRALRRYSGKLLLRAPKHMQRLELAARTVMNDPSVLKRAVRHVLKNGLKDTLNRSLQAIEYRYAPGAATVRLDAQQTTFILTTHHCLFVAELIKRNLAAAGYAAEIIFSSPENGFADSLHFVICPQMFPALPGTYVAFQMEQSVSSRWFSEDYFKTLEHSYAILDYSLTNIKYLQDNGLSLRQVHYVPISYIPNYRNLSDTPKEYDIVFYGDINNDRRKAYLSAIRQKYKVKIINDLFGDELYREIAKARLVLNIHYYEGALLESTRLYECLSLDAMIVSEMSVDMEEHKQLSEIVDFVPVGDISAMLTRIDYWLDNPNALEARLEKNRTELSSAANSFNYYFNRFLLATDSISFDSFYELAGHNISFSTDRICLGLPEATERRKDFEKDNTEGFQYIPGLRHAIGWIGCGMSYKFLIRKAKEQGFKSISICEDDVEFLPHWKERLQLVSAKLQQDDETWDIFAGLIAHLHPETQVISAVDLGELKLVKIDKMVSMVFNTYHARVFDRILEWNEIDRNPETNTIDRYIESQKNSQIYTTAPFIVGHKEELSSTLWGFKNTQYSDMIRESSRLLTEKVNEFQNRS